MKHHPNTWYAMALIHRQSNDMRRYYLCMRRQHRAERRALDRIAAWYAKENVPA